MGITDFSIKLLNKVFQDFHPTSVCELGDQNLYTSDGNYGKYADLYYKSKGLGDYDYVCIDLNGGNDAMVIDMGKLIVSPPKFHLVTDFGFQEHVGTDGKFDWEAIYNCWLNKFNLCKRDGHIISENPLTGHWEGHGFQWFCEDFYYELANVSDLGIIDIGQCCAMGNCETGKNVYCVMVKMGDRFPSFEEFKTLPLKQS